MVGADRTVLLDIRETVAQLVVQTSRQSGAAAVYTELFDFDGDEIYFLDRARPGGRDVRRGPARLRERQRSSASSPDGVPTLNPPGDTASASSTLVVVAEDDSALVGAGAALAAPDQGQLGQSTRRASSPTPARW